MDNNKKGYLAISIGVAVLTLVAIVANTDNEDQPSPTVKSKVEKPFVQKPQKKTEPKPKKVSEFVIRYAGEYTILVDDFHAAGTVEKLFLRPDGSCSWEWTQNGRLQSAKDGTWTAEKGKIFTVIRGNSGNIPEDFTYRAGAFRNGHRYLKRIRK